jgi:uncharacterized alpha/beta hydrolase family protein
MSQHDGPREATGAGKNDAEDKTDEKVPFSSSFTVERAFRVDGKRVVVQAVIPAAAAKEIGMEATLEAARRMLIRLESKEARVEELRRGD